VESQHNSIIALSELQCWPEWLRCGVKLSGSRSLRCRRAPAEQAQERNMSTKPARKASNPHLGSDFDDFLREEGLYDEAQVMGALRSAPQHAMLATLTSKGQVTIPKRIRDALRLQPGAVVEFSVSATGEVVLHQRRSTDHLISNDSQPGSLCEPVAV
jgi:AbrB family looped-hinge helix DNA binding protein